MITIKKSSWHYKMVECILKRPSYSLCVYFWQCVLSILILISIGFMLMFLFITVVVSPILTFVFFVYPPFTEYMTSFPDGHLLPSLIVVGEFVIICGIGLGLFQGGVYLFKYIKLRILKKGHTVNKQPGLVSEYIKAKKDKVCPTIIYQEDE